jgi:hypothetical protein
MAPKRISIIFFRVFLLAAMPTIGHAFTLDTPPVLDTVHPASCLITNLHPSKPCDISASSGLYINVGLGRAQASSNNCALDHVDPVTLGPGRTARTVDRVACAQTDPFPQGTGQSAGNPISCHFEVTGCPKGKIQAVLSLDGGAVVPAK